MFSLIYHDINTDFVAPALAQFMKVIAFFLLIGSLLSFYLMLKRRRLVSAQTGMDSIKSLSWRQYEDLITEAYKRNGYSVVREPVDGSDQGIDIIVARDGVTVLIQCKQWKARKVGVRLVRELFGVLHAANANEAHIVTTGYFTNEAMQFAEGKQIKLIYGGKLLDLISMAQKNLSGDSNIEETAPTCLKCCSEMLMKTAKRGKYTGRDFWGCSRFPDCRETMAL